MESREEQTQRNRSMMTARRESIIANIRGSKTNWQRVYWNATIDYLIDSA